MIDHGKKLSLTAALAVVLAFAAASCASARHIRQAQDAFNHAATDENRVFAVGRDAMVAQPSFASGATNYYRTALALVDRELGDNLADLKQDHLYGTALMLKAMCLWRLADLEDLAVLGDASAQPSAKGPSARDDGLSATLQTVRRELDAGSITIGERDRVMLFALPGLRDHDRGLRAKTMDRARAFFESAIDETDKAPGLAHVDERHPVVIYVRCAQLSSCRAWQDAAGKLAADADERNTEIKAASARAKSVLTGLKPLYDENPALKAIVSSLANRLGVALP